MELQVELRVVGQVALAMLLGGAIGLEREYAHRPAGLRTHMLLSGASALLVGLAFTIVRQLGGATQYPLLKIDPTIVIQAIVTAVGFIGAGTILRHPGGDHIEGLTTAVSLLLVAAIGSCVALGQVALAAGVTLLALATLYGVRRVEAKIHKGKGPSPGPDAP